MIAFEANGVRVWDRDGKWIVIQAINPYDQPRLVLTREEAREVYGFLAEYFGGDS